MGTKLQQAQADQAESLKTLREILKPGDEVYTLVRSVAASGMSRRISLFVVRGNRIEDITWNAARAMGEKVKQGGKYVQDAGMLVDGCGMDMCFATVYSLGSYLFPDGFGLRGGLGDERSYRPESKDDAAKLAAVGWKFERGRNGDTSGWDDSGGYALKYRSL